MASQKERFHLPVPSIFSGAFAVSFRDVISLSKTKNAHILFFPEKNKSSSCLPWMLCLWKMYVQLQLWRHSDGQLATSYMGYRFEVSDTCGIYSPPLKPIFIGKKWWKTDPILEKAFFFSGYFGAQLAQYWLPRHKCKPHVIFSSFFQIPAAKCLTCLTSKVQILPGMFHKVAKWFVTSVSPTEKTVIGKYMTVPTYWLILTLPFGICAIYFDLKVSRVIT